MPIRGCNPRVTSDIAFFVEGEMERDAFRQLFGVKAKRIGINGDAVSMDAIHRNLTADLLRMPGQDRIFIMFDREGRRESPDELSEELDGLLRRRFPDKQFKIVIPDRDTESWLFSDTEVAAGYFKKNIGRGAVFEGRRGASEIKRYIGQGRYEKMIDGVRMMEKVRWSVLKARSQSARAAALEDYLPECVWLAR